LKTWAPVLMVVEHMSASVDSAEGLQCELRRLGTMIEQVWDEALPILRRIADALEAH
jgi:uncharacterized protein YqgV (UPF0045/DUF77 family)